MSKCNCGGLKQEGSFIHSETCERSVNHYDAEEPIAFTSHGGDESPLPDPDNIMDWFEGPLTELRLAQLRLKLAKARGLLICLINWETDQELLPTTQEIITILKETEDP